MKAVVITRQGGPEVLQLREVPDLQPGPGLDRLSDWTEATDAHRGMEASRNCGKIVLRVGP